jgi:hypothetical protein
MEENGQKLSRNEVAAMIAEVRKTQEACKVLNDRLQALCPHEEYVEGLTIIACIQPILICTTCGHAKPIERHSDVNTFYYGGIPPQD